MIYKFFRYFVGFQILGLAFFTMYIIYFIYSGCSCRYVKINDQKVDNTSIAKKDFKNKSQKRLKFENNVKNELRNNISKDFLQCDIRSSMNLGKVYISMDIESDQDRVKNIHLFVNNKFVFE